MKNLKLILSLLTIVFLFNSCNKDALDSFDVVYEITFESDWSASTHPTDFPSNAHFSPMVGMSHLSSYSVFVEGLVADDGVKEVAELGSTDAIEHEFTKQMNTGFGKFQFKGNAFDSPGEDKVEVGVEAGYHTVTVMSMIAPSPDWFVAATVSLIDPNDGLFYDEVVVYATVYDAGTDAGTTFTSADDPLDPREAITVLSEGPLTEGTDTVVNMGKFIFTKVK